MGQSLTSLKSLNWMRNIYRPVKNYNVEERAFRAISKDKPTPAPAHPKMRKIMEDIRNDPELLTRGRMDPKTMENLSRVFITSEGDNTSIGSRRRLPEDRKGHGDYEYGYEEPKHIPKGKASMRQILELISKRQTDANVNTPEKLAEDYNLSLVDVNNLLTYFKAFEVHIPPKAKKAPRERNPAKLLQQKIDQLKE